MAASDPHMRLRLPQEDKDWIEAQAKRNASSRNSEVVRSIRERRERTERQAVRDRMEREAVDVR